MLNPSPKPKVKKAGYARFADMFTREMNFPKTLSVRFVNTA